MLRKLARSRCRITQPTFSNASDKTPPRPCATMQFFTGMPQNWFGFNNESVSYVDLEVRRYTKLRRIVWNYSLTNLYAEIGSYVGLFLGVAIVHCTALIDVLHSWIVDTSAVQVTK